MSRSQSRPIVVKQNIFFAELEGLLRRFLDWTLNAFAAGL
jgi:hypothetical protein